MNNRIPRRRRIGSFKHKKGNTPYKWYNPDKRECKLQPEDQAHMDSIKKEEQTINRRYLGRTVDRS